MSRIYRYRIPVKVFSYEKPGEDIDPGDCMGPSARKV